MQSLYIALCCLCTLSLLAPMNALASAQAEAAADCGAIYVWGRDVQNEPYNAEAREARCAKAGQSPPKVQKTQTDDTGCGKMYVWGREVQDEPYNAKARDARCARGW